MLLVKDEKMKRAGAVVTLVTAKSLLPLATMPVGDPPGMVMNGVVDCLKKGCHRHRPDRAWMCSISSFDTQKGLLAVAVIPHGFDQQWIQDWREAGPIRYEVCLPVGGARWDHRNCGTDRRLARLGRG